MGITKKTRILVVEDEPDIAGIMKHALERAGDLNVEIVGTGAAALKSVMEDPPGLVLLDLNLPKKPGHEVLAAIKADPALRCIPVVVLTSSSAESDVRRSYELAANGYVTKPTGLDDFFGLVRAIERFWPTPRTPLGS